MGSAGIRESLGRQVATVAPFEYALTEEVAHLDQVEPGVERHLRLDLRVLLNQNNGTWGTTNAIADDLAKILLRNFDIREKGEWKPDTRTLQWAADQLEVAFGDSIPGSKSRLSTKESRRLRALAENRNVIEDTDG